MKPHDGAQWILLQAIAVAGALLVTGCEGLFPKPDTAPRFTGTVGNQIYTAGVPICALRLPKATGGNGDLSYSLRPRIPGLRFDSNSHTITGTPTTAGVHQMTYRVQDADENTSAADFDTRKFTITITAREPGRDIYRGCGDQVFILDAFEGSIDYTLELGNAPVAVYLIATNPTRRYRHSTVHRIDASTSRATGTEPSQPERIADAPGAGRREWSLFEQRNISPPHLLAGAEASFQAEPLPPQQPVATGDTFTFGVHEPESNIDEVRATARKVVTDGTVTLAVWVADDQWGACSTCVRQRMIDALAEPFLRPGQDNDIYDWVTAIFGDPWGPHQSSYLIPPEYARQIHILLYDIDGDSGATEEDEVSRGGYFDAGNNYQRSLIRSSNERLMFYLDAPALAAGDDGPRYLASSAVHEFQHLIHYYQKGVLRDARSESWLNEMCSEVAEDLLADKLMTYGPRGVAHDDPTAGDRGIRFGRLPLYNLHNDIQATVWHFEGKYYSINYALGAYLARNYGGAELFGAIVRNDRAGTEAIEEALSAQGDPLSFGEVLLNWGVANLLSDDTGAPHPYRYNSGTWQTSQAGGGTFRLGSINLFNYRTESQVGPKLYSIPDFNPLLQPPHSNRYVRLGRHTGTLLLRLAALEGMRITAVVKG